MTRPPPFPLETYSIIYADPPWRYRNKNTGGSMKSGASAKYQTMDLEDICALPIKNLARKDAVLFIWATTPLLPWAMQVMQAWGFEYKSKLVWRKIMSLGMGYWFRIQTEDLLLGVRGNVKAFRCQLPNVIQTKALAHSEKPEEFRVLIERATRKMPRPKRIELFARKRFPGWTAWGNEVT